LLKAREIGICKYSSERSNLVVLIPGRIQAMIDLLVSILKWGTERLISRLRKDKNKNLELNVEKEVFIIPPLLVTEGIFLSD